MTSGCCCYCCYGSDQVDMWLIWWSCCCLGCDAVVRAAMDHK